MCCWLYIHSHFFSFISTLVPLSSVGTTWFSSCCDKDLEILLRPAACLTSTLFESVVGASDCKCSWTNSLTCRPKHGGEIINFGHPSDDWPLRTLLSFRNRAPSALTAGPSSSLSESIHPPTTWYLSIMNQSIFCGRQNAAPVHWLHEVIFWQRWWLFLSHTMINDTCTCKTVPTYLQNNSILIRQGYIWVEVLTLNNVSFINDRATDLIYWRAWNPPVNLIYY
jgi:hypothetical protein